MPRRGGDKLPELEGLRGLAALFVVFSHLQWIFFEEDFRLLLERLAKLGPGLSELATALAMAPFNGRFFIWIFWTLSGFALSYHYFQVRDTRSAAHSRIYLLDASLRRYPRLLIPVLAATLFAWLLCETGAMQNVALAAAIYPPDHPNDWLTVAYSFTPSLGDAVRASFWDTFFSFHISPRYDPPLWTMKRELIGSFVVFGFLAIAGGLRWRWLAYLVVGGAALIVHQIWLNSFLAGIVLCDLRVHHLSGLRPALAVLEPLRRSCPLAAAGTLLLVAAIGAVSQRELHELNADPVSDTAYIFLSAAIIAWMQFSRPLRRFFTRPEPVFLGRISFGVYISHYPLLFSLAAAWYLALAGTWSHLVVAWLTAFLSVPAVLGVGTIFYLFADRPALSLSRRLAQRVLQVFRREETLARTISH